MNKLVNTSKTIQTLLAHLSPQALHRVLGPAGPRRIIGVDFEPVPQCVHLTNMILETKLANITSKLV